jgi:methyl-accepting chemotaxis protein
MANNIYEQLRDALKEFKEFLEKDNGEIKGVLSQVVSNFPPLGGLIKSLLDLLDDLKAEIADLADNLEDIDKARSFAKTAQKVVEAGKELLTDSPVVETVLDVVKVINDIPSLADVQTEIDETIGLIKGHLQDVLDNAANS